MKIVASDRGYSFIVEESEEIEVVPKVSINKPRILIIRVIMFRVVLIDSLLFNLKVYFRLVYTNNFTYENETF